MPPQSGFVARIEGEDAGSLDDDLGLVVAELVELVGEGIPLPLAREDAHGLVASEGDALDFHLRRSAAAIFEGVPGHFVPGKIGDRFGKLRPLRGDEIDEGARHGDLVDGGFGEADADGVADAVGAERADPDGALDPAVLAVAGFSDAEVDGIIPIVTEFGETGDKKPVGLDHDLGIARLHRKDEVVVAAVAGDPGELERTLDHAERRVAEAGHDAVAEGSVVRPDAHGGAAGLGLFHERPEFLLDPGEFLGVLFVGVFADLELLLVGVIPGIDEDLLDPLHRLHRGVGFEMDVGDEGHVAPLSTDPRDDVFKICRDLAGLGGDPDNLTTGRDEVHRFLHAVVGLARVARQH